MRVLAKVLLLLVGLPLSAADRPAEVVVLCTLHQMHEEVSSYSYAALSDAIVRLQPTVLMVELTPSDLAGRAEQKNKREYQNSVYPLLQQHKWTAVAMEPEGPQRAELLGRVREAEERLAREAPQKLEAFQFYVESLFSYLQPRWRSPADANAPWTDDQFAVKHAFQNKLFGPKEEEGWEGWNHYFLDRITVTAKVNPGSRVVVLVGVEHCYWLRAHLRNAPGTTLLDTASLLR
jgi:hypothetical protein